MKKLMDLLVYFWPQKMAGLSCENLQMLEAFSIFLGGGGGVSQNAPIISSIIFNFWLVTSVILILKCALKAPKNDVLKTIWHHFWSFTFFELFYEKQRFPSEKIEFFPKKAISLEWIWLKKWTKVAISPLWIWFSVKKTLLA